MGEKKERKKKSSGTRRRRNAHRNGIDILVCSVMIGSNDGDKAEKRERKWEKMGERGKRE